MPNKEINFHLSDLLITNFISITANFRYSYCLYFLSKMIYFEHAINYYYLTNFEMQKIIIMKFF